MVHAEKQTRMVKLRALMFARARELSGSAEVEISILEGSTTDDCVAELVSRFPSLDVLRGSAVVALNFNYVVDPVVVKDGDELAIIPPISGG